MGKAPVLREMQPVAVQLENFPNGNPLKVILSFLDKVNAWNRNERLWPLCGGCAADVYSRRLSSAPTAEMSVGSTPRLLQLTNSIAATQQQSGQTFRSNMKQIHLALQGTSRLLLSITLPAS